MSVKPCTWEIERPDGEGVAIELCGHDAVLEFSHKVKVMGRIVVKRYPRCKRHASARVISWARGNGYDIHTLEGE